MDFSAERLVLGYSSLEKYTRAHKAGGSQVVDVEMGCVRQSTKPVLILS